MENQLNWNDSCSTDQHVPINLQNYFWGLTSAFIKPKVGKLHENSCLFCQHIHGHHEMKEASKSFERLLVQDIRTDVPDTLKKEFKSLSRWHIIQASLPHLIHSTAAILQNRKGTNIQYIGAVEAKLLHILHWILLEAPDECADSDYEKGVFQTSPHFYLYNIPSITLFVYLFAPLVNQMKESDLLNNGLEGGLKLWQALWESRAPNNACFTAHCKPKPKSIWYNLKQLSQDKFRNQDYSSHTLSASASSTHINANDSFNKSVEEEIWIASPKEKYFPETIPEENSSTEDEQVVIFHIPPCDEYNFNTENVANSYSIKPSIFQLPIGKSDSLYTFEELAAITSPEMKQLQKRIKISESKKKSNSNNYKSSSILTEESLSVDLYAATFLDVAVLRCLFVPQWCEEGVYWCLQYLYHRLQNINENIKIKQEPRRRSNSLPIPKIEVSFHHEPDYRGKIVKQNYSNNITDLGDSSPEIVKDRKRTFFDDRDLPNVHSRQTSERIKKKKKIVDLKSFVGCKLLSKSEKNLQKIDYINEIIMLEQNSHNTLFTSDELSSTLLRKLDFLFQNNKTTTFLNRGKSLPSLRVNDLKNVKNCLNPTITITEHSGITSPDINFYKARFFEEFKFDSLFPQGQKLCKELHHSNLTRSQTDSNITYISEEILEVPGSQSYITKDGDVDLDVVLRAIHFSVYQINTSKTFRVCEVIINLLELLLDLGILQQTWPGDSSKISNNNLYNPNITCPDYVSHLSYSKPMSAHALVMSSIIRVIQNLGCPHSCGDGHKGPPANFVRSQCQLLLNRLKQNDKKQFSNYLRHFIKTNSLTCVINFIHSYIGFCTEPIFSNSPMCNKRKSIDTMSQLSGSPSGYGSLNAACSRGNEYHVINVIFRSLISRVVKSFKELKQPENTDIYSTVKFLIGYIKDVHSSIFKRVMLSGLIDVAYHKDGKNCNTQTTRVIRHIPLRDHEEHTKSITEPFILDNVNRKLLFKKRSTLTSFTSAFENQISEDIKNQIALINLKKKKNPMISKPSEGSMQCPKKSYSERLQIKEIVNWISSKSNVQECRGKSQAMSSYDSTSDVGSLVRQAANLHQSYCRGSNKSNSRMTSKFKKTKKRVGHQLNKYVFRKGRKKDKSTEDSQGSYLSRRDSLDDGDHPHQSEFVVLKERKLVQIKQLRMGIQRFSVMMEICGPGSVPDANLISAAFDLPNTPVLARAAFLLECCYYVHSCNKGQWSAWMRMMMRPSGLNFKSSTMLNGLKKSAVVQHNTGKLFRQWGEIIAARIDEMIAEDKKKFAHISLQIHDETYQHDLQNEDEEEDFLDETSGISQTMSCPMVLRIVACMLFLEITSYLRETYRSRPKARPSNPYTTLPVTTNPWERETRQSHSKEGRRWSMALSSMGHSQASAQSLQSIACEKEQEMEKSGNELSQSHLKPEEDVSRKSSIVVATTVLTKLRRHAKLIKEKRAPDKGKTCLKRNDNEQPTKTENSNPNVHFNQWDDNGPIMIIDEKKSKSSNQQSIALSQRRGTAGSFKRYSLKLRRNTKEGIKEIISSDGDYRSDTSDGCAAGITGDASGEEESAAMMSDEHIPVSPCDSNETDDTTYFMPWLKSVIQINKSFDYNCTHQSFCHPLCYKRYMRSCSRLIKAIRKLYGEEFGLMSSLEQNAELDEFVKITKVETKKNLQISSCQTSPNKRKDSLGKIENSSHLYNISENISNSKKLLLKSDSKIQEKKENHNQRNVNHDTPLILKYMKNQVHNLFHCSMSLMIKAAVVLTEEQVLDVLPIAWEFLLDSNQELVASSSALFIIAAFKAPHKSVEVMNNSLTSKDTTIRANAILKFHVLWKNRYQPWPRMEEGAHNLFRVPPPGIEFTLTSPKIGIECLPTVDPPWMPQVETKVEEVAIGQDTHRSLVTATKTRKKQQTELIKMALEAKEDQRRNERESFLVTAIPINSQAAHEQMHHGLSDLEYDEEIDEHENQTRVITHHSVPTVTVLFPSTLCSAVVEIISLLNDPAVTDDGTSVYETAYEVIWTCLVEDCNLFLRFVFERLTRDNQEKMFKLLRHLIRFVPKLPHQAAFILYNYIIGYVMFYVRSPHEEGQAMIGSALSILWMVVHSVHGIMFKDLKQILRKEQCDGSILLTANVPSTKKVVVHGPQEQMSGGIPSQFPVQEDTQFIQILKESLDFFGIQEERQKEFFLVNIKTRQIHNPNSYVRDYYFFKRSQYPQLELIQLDLVEAFNQLQSQELIHKFIEIGKVLLTWAILKNVDMVVQRVVFLHEELIKLPSFPRKALDADLDLYKGGSMGKELLGLDLLHKFMWVRLIARMFEAMAGNFAYSGDIHLFLNVLNGAVTLHCEDSCILRYVMATYINAARNFKNIFSSNGYLLIIPTLLQLYASHHTNKIVTRSIEYTIKQFYLMNRKPFILQMFGSASSILDLDDATNTENSNKVEANYFFKLILSLETPSPDPIHISELIKEEKPLQAVDFCYQDEDDTITVQDCTSLCVMVIAFSPETLRSYQMLLILEAILPCYLNHIQQPKYREIERDVINQLITSIKTLINNSEALSKHYNGPQKSSPDPKDSSQRNCSKGLCSPTGGVGETKDMETNSKMFSERKSHKTLLERDQLDCEIQLEEKCAALRNEFRRTRDVLLSVVTDFVVICHARLIELSRKYPQEGKPFEILDTRMHIRLGEVAHSLLKVSPYDPETMSCKGLLKYMTNILPIVDWAAEPLRPTLLGILRRLDRTFNKIYKKPSIRRYTDWYAAGELIKGIYDTLSEHPFIVHIPHFKTLVSTCQGIIVGEYGSTTSTGTDNFQQAAIPIETPPPHFCAIVIRLLALHILAIGENYTLEQSVGGMNNIMSSQVKTESFLMNLFLPLCFRVGVGKKDMHNMRSCDIKFMLSVILNSMSPPVKTTCLTFVQLTNIKQSSDLRTNSFTFNRDSKTSPTVSKSFFKVLFLALKIMLVCFETELALQYQRIAHTVKELMNVQDARASLWSFVEFIIVNRSPLFILLQPFILQRLGFISVSELEVNSQNLVKEKLSEYTAITPQCRSSLLVELMNEMTEIKQELDDRLIDEQRSRTNNGIRNSCETQHRPSVINLLPGSSNPTYSVCAISHRESISSVRSNFSGQDKSLNSIIQKESKNSDGDPTEFGIKPETRLQRTRAQSRKTFRFRKNNMKVIHHGLKSPQQTREDNTMNTENKEFNKISNVTDDRLLITKPEMIWEEDNHSAPSRTSSTSGYRENCSLLMMPMGSSDENSSSPIHHCLTNSSSTIIPIESPIMSKDNNDIGSQLTIATCEEDTLI
ncbi:protein unc-80 homolog isoform X3 [Daktulosphaira vitifoliae]|uniref:protein unc-80 homolog isoform X3 n=1 Tax=Daktulosphaira vitifoliae TaxID=58002 RepID=UPI0021AAF3A2|nr:protein unc-80 homolog isoform X3 [Daktulosphaira vitifoliae]